MNERQTQLGLEERPKTDVQRWRRLIPEHIYAMLFRHGFLSLPFEKMIHELRIQGELPQAESLIERLCAIEERYDDRDNVLLSQVFEWDEWLPPRPNIKLNPDRLQKLETLFVQLGCKRLYDIWILGKNDIPMMLERDTDILELWEYLYEYASDVIRKNAEHDENEDEDPEDDDTDISHEWRRSMVDEDERFRSSSTQWDTIYHNDTHHHHAPQWMWFIRTSVVVIVTAILSSVTVKRGYVNTDALIHDFKKIVEKVGGNQESQSDTQRQQSQE